MEKQLKKEIKSDRQIIKFCMYGLFKDIKFFDAYIVLFFLINNFSLFQIGVLVAIREAIIFIFEIPSGMIADKIGRKVELCVCFIFYIISFCFFFFASQYIVAIFAMIFYGLGEAFRSGSHKAMIYTYLDIKGWTKNKTFVYGRTRSFSLIGSAIGSILGVLIAIFMKDLKWVFAITIIPYLIDFILILTYPKNLNFSGNNADKKSFRENLRQLKANFTNKENGKTLTRLLIGEGVFESAFSIVKDYIQPAIEGIIVGMGILIFSGLSAENNLKIVLGVVYAINSLFGSVVSKNSYRLTGKVSKLNILNWSIISLTLIVISSGLLYKALYPLVIVFVLMYCVQNIRKPVFVDKIDDYVSKNDRATILSIGSGLKSLLVIILSPLVGYFADTFGIQWALLSVSALILVTIPFSICKNKKEINL